MPGKFFLRAIVIAAVFISLAGCAAAWKRIFIPPPLKVDSLISDTASPQVVNSVSIRWTAWVSGGVGARTYEFHLLRGKEDKLVQTGPSPFWDWRPDQPGQYRIRALVTDALDNTADSGWSPDYEIVPVPFAEITNPDKLPPQAANSTAIRWTVRVTGGVGPHTYKFRLIKDKEDKVVQTGPSPFWDWRPDEAGRYKVKAEIRDVLGNTANSEWSPEYEIVPAMHAEKITFDKLPPQAANTSSIRWTVRATGGVGPHTYEFHILKGKEDKMVQAGPLPYWDWRPGQAGRYRVKAVASDTLGNKADSGFSPDYEVVPGLLVEEISADRLSPQTANIAKIRWTVKSKGGAGPYTYEFHLQKGNEDRVVQTGPLPYWDWRPDEAGQYRVRAVVSDILGNTAEGVWSPEYEIRQFMRSSLIAVLPLENLSGTRVPLKNIRKHLIDELKNQGANIIDDDVLEGFMSRRRIRYTGAIDLENAGAFKKELGTDAVLITSVEFYSEENPPKISLISRLTSTGVNPEILWMDHVGISGDDSPGILGLGLIEDPSQLLQDAVKALTGSLMAGLSAGENWTGTAPDASGLFPKIFYRSPVLSPAMKYRIAVMPFLNKSDRKYAGDVLALHFVNELRGLGLFDVIEPGIVRNNLLEFRVIMNEGISFDNAGLIFSTLETDADLILSGTVIDYQDYQGSSGTPKVDFSVLAIEKKSREVVWTSKSYRTGDEGVIFFDVGRINVAQPLASRMIKGIAEMLLTE